MGGCAADAGRYTPPAMAQLLPIADVPATAVEALLDAAFGTGRRARTAYRLRPDTAAIPALSFAAVDDVRLIGSIQCWPVRHVADDGAVTPLTLVGPVAVDPVWQGRGIGRMLTTAALGRADALGLPPQLLIGDPDYYGRFFGFSAAATGSWRLPGPVERHRLLARAAAPTTAGDILPLL